MSTRAIRFESNMLSIIRDFADRQAKKNTRIVPSHLNEAWRNAIKAKFGDWQSQGIPTEIFELVIAKAVEASPIVCDEVEPPKGWAIVPKKATSDWAKAIQRSDLEVDWPHEMQLIYIVDELFGVAPQYQGDTTSPTVPA